MPAEKTGAIRHPENKNKIRTKQPQKAPSSPPRKAFLPVSLADMASRGWEELDILIVTGDAYVDHPSFGHAIIARWLEAHGFRVGVVSQPDWRGTEEFAKLGRPRLCVMLSAGNLDSMLNHYTASGKKRRRDDYTPGGAAGRRPDRATIVYANRVRELWGDIPLVIGGIEAMPTSLLSPASTITTTLTTSMAVYAEGSAQDDVLWALGLLLMGMSLIFILIIHLIGRKGAKARG